MNPLTDEEVLLMALNIDDADWNDTSCRDCWHDGFKAAARAIEAAPARIKIEHSTTPTAGVGLNC